MDAANTSNPSDKKKFIWLVILLIIAIAVSYTHLTLPTKRIV